MMRPTYWMHAPYSPMEMEAIYQREKCRALILEAIHIYGDARRIIAEEIGTSPAVLRRFINGSVPDSDLLKRMRQWGLMRPTIYTSMGGVILAAVAELYPAPLRREARQRIATELAPYHDLPDGSARWLRPWVMR